MLQLKIPAKELYNSNTNEFITTKETVLKLEHSLVSVSKWESKWKKPFISETPKTRAEMNDYVRCMTTNEKDVDPIIYSLLDNTAYQAISDYIEDPMTATWFSEKQTRRKANSGEAVTSEIIYYWMIACNIPVEFQKWHLNRLITLIRVCSIKNEAPNKMSKKDVLSQNRALNAARRKPR